MPTFLGDIVKTIKMKNAPFKSALKFWSKLGFRSSGGAVGQIAITYQEKVEHQHWIGENQFLRALNFCMPLSRHNP
jgi:chromate transporter